VGGKMDWVGVAGVGLAMPSLLPTDTSLTHNQLAFAVPGTPTKNNPRRERAWTTQALLGFQTGGSSARFDLAISYDYVDIIAAYTLLAKADGYGGSFVSDSASVLFGGTPWIPQADGVGRYLLTFMGFQNVAGVGFHFFSGALIVTGQGEVLTQDCQLAGDTHLVKKTPSKKGGDTPRYLLQCATTGVSSALGGLRRAGRALLE
jgi:hypothetical protein